MKTSLVSLIAVLTLLGLVGCGKSDEAAVAPTPEATGTGNSTPPLSADTPDFSSDERVTATVIPMLIGKFGSDPTLTGTTLNIELKDKTLHITGDVKSNDQKRKIDEIVKTVEAPASAAGYKFMNMAIVKG